jgi:hypothetical protein
VPCIDRSRPASQAAALLLLAGLVSACGNQRSPPPAPPAPAADASQREPARPAPADTPVRRPAPTPVPAALPRHWDDYRVQAARRIVAANPQGTYLGEVPQPALAIPVLEIELNADGSVRRTLVTRRPSQALDTVQLAIEAVHRAAPFGPVGHLPRPWKFTEVFLFDDQRRFKPRSLDD